MNEVLTNKLLDDFPQLFRHRNETSIQRGFECGDGWFDLIYTLSQDVEAAARESGLNPDAPEWPLCRQVKQKRGSLRFVIFAVDGFDELNERISELRLAAVNQSLQICEHCGKPGELVTEGCIATMCPSCAMPQITCHTGGGLVASFIRKLDSDPRRIVCLIRFLLAYGVDLTI